MDCDKLASFVQIASRLDQETLIGESKLAKCKDISDEANTIESLMEKLRPEFINCLDQIEVINYVAEEVNNLVDQSISARS